jgi:hypothetical protein
MRSRLSAVALLVLTVVCAAGEARADENLYQVLRAPMYLKPTYGTDWPDDVTKRQAAATSDMLRRIEQEMFEPALYTRDLSNPFSNSLRSQSTYYKVTGLEPAR